MPARTGVCAGAGTGVEDGTGAHTLLRQDQKTMDTME